MWHNGSKLVTCRFVVIVLDIGVDL